MKTPIKVMLSCLLMASLPGTVLAQAKTVGNKLYCWDENGVQVCGDTLPPSAVNRARTEISSRTGNRTGQVLRALTGDERTAAELADKAARQAADATAAAQRRDLAMVNSYQTEDDLRAAYAERITLNDESVKTSRMSIGNLHQSLLSLLRQASESELQARPVEKPLADKIVRQHNDLLRMKVLLQDQMRHGSELNTDLDNAVKRYREMKAAADA